MQSRGQFTALSIQSRPNRPTARVYCTELATAETNQLPMLKIQDPLSHFMQVTTMAITFPILLRARARVALPCGILPLSSAESQYDDRDFTPSPSPSLSRNLRLSFLLYSIVGGTARRMVDTVPSGDTRYWN